MSCLNEHKILLSATRSGYLDVCFWGSIFLANKDGIYFQYGLKKDTIAFTRSLAKPLQASIIADCNIVDDYKLKTSEIAMFSASHAGSKTHVAVLRNILKKHKIKISDLSLVPQLPLDMRNFKGKKTKLQNNCSAKHIMMILMSKYLGFNIKNYEKPNHPIQNLIHKKQNELSGFESEILTFDGCSAPLWGLPFENIIEAYFNLFNNSKYNFIFNSIKKHPYLFGGYDRLDSEIITLSKGKLFAKTGAGGFFIVYNFENNEIFLLKMAQNNNDVRKLVVFDILSKLNWLKLPVCEYELNQKKQNVAKYSYCVNFG